MKTISILENKDFANIKICEINKDDAKEFLTSNSKNRPISNSSVNDLVKTMNDGRWIFNGDTIVFDSDGFLKSGQHRLTAFVKSNLETITIIVVYLKNSKDVLLSLNRGRRLTTAQYLTVLGYSNSKYYQACSRWLQRAIENKLEGNVVYLDYETEHIVDENKTLIDKFMPFNRCNRNPISSIVCAMGAYAILKRPDFESMILSEFENASQLIGGKDSLASSIMRLNAMACRVRSQHETSILAEKTLSLLAGFIGCGYVKDKLYGISIDDFNKAISKEAK